MALRPYRGRVGRYASHRTTRYCESFARECDVKCLRTFHQVPKMLGDGLPADAAMCRSLQLYRLLTDLDTAAAKGKAVCAEKCMARARGSACLTAGKHRCLMYRAVFINSGEC